METYLHDFVNEYFNLETKNKKFTFFVSKMDSKYTCLLKKEVNVLQEMEILNKLCQKYYLFSHEWSEFSCSWIPAEAELLDVTSIFNCTKNFDVTFIFKCKIN